MNDEIDILEDVLKQSLKNNGDIPLTIRHLLNIVRMVQRMRDHVEQEGLEQMSTWESDD